MDFSDLETIPESGAVFTIGRSRFADNIASHFFIRKDPVVYITCGDEHSGVICQSGRLFVFGSNDWGQLGLGHKNHVSKPSCVKALKPQKVTHVACGRAHTLMCTESKKIFACGCDQEGQLGRGGSTTTDSANIPVLVYDSESNGATVVQIAAGSHHSLALTSDGSVIAWGSNLEGQLGLPGMSGLINKPTKLNINEKVKQISAGYYHSAFLTESGSLYVCGESESGKLGIEVSFSSQAAPKQIELPAAALHVACGGHHTLILQENGDLYCTGSNANGQLGLGMNITEVQTPKLVPAETFKSERISFMATGESHSAILTETGKLFTCGDGRHGKLGLEENENNVHEFTLAPRYQDLFVSSVSCGGCHTILVARRRDSNKESTEISQLDPFQKKNPLPPLKLPAYKLQNENHLSEKEVEKEKEIEGEKELEKNKEKGESEKIDENQKEKEEQKETETDAERENDKEENMESRGGKTETAENIYENINNVESNSNEIPVDIVDANVLTKSTEMENGGANALETEKLTEEHMSKDEKINRKDVVGEETSEKTNEEETGENDLQEVGKAETPTTPVIEKEDKKEDEQSKEAKENKESKESSPEKKELRSPTPPPKPPRLKPDIGQSSEIKPENENTAVAAVSEKGHKDESEQESTKKNEFDEVQIDKQEKKSPGERAKSSSKSGHNEEETIQFDNQNDANSVETNKNGEKTKEDGQDVANGKENEPDEADVQSPVQKIVKKSRIFGKKHEEVENGAKAGAVQNKSKSRTCTVL